MAQNITLLGASYSAVPAVDLPKTGGGTARFTDVTDTTAAASDVAVGKYFYDANGTKTEGTNSGGGGGAAISIVDEPLPGGGTAKHITGVDISSDTVDAAHLAQGYTAHDASGTAIVGTMSGGASNFVSGTFTTISSTGAVGTVTIPYTGSGYPVAAIVVVEGGMYNPDISGWYDAIRRYAVGFFTYTKSVATSTPTYSTSGEENQGVVTVVYKSSATSSTGYARTGLQNVIVLSSSDAGSAATNVVKFTGNATTLSYYVLPDNSSGYYGLMENTTYRYYVVYSS